MKKIMLLLLALNFVSCAPASSDSPLAEKVNPEETAIECYAANTLNQYGAIEIGYFDYATGKKVLHRSVCDTIDYSRVVNNPGL